MNDRSNRFWRVDAIFFMARITLFGIIVTSCFGLKPSIVLLYNSLVKLYTANSGRSGTLPVRCGSSCFDCHTIHPDLTRLFDHKRHNFQVIGFVGLLIEECCESSIRDRTSRGRWGHLTFLTSPASTRSSTSIILLSIRYRIRFRIREYNRIATGIYMEVAIRTVRRYRSLVSVYGLVIA